MHWDVIKKARRALQKTLIGFINVYRYCLSPLLGPRCRFYPSCSSYAKEAITRFGIIKGGVLTAKRLLRCHPFNPGGVDPVPQHKHSR